MPLYEVTDTGLRSHHAATFAGLGLYERADLQPLLRDDISPLDPELLVIAEEFGQWEDARRRIDLLALDRSGRLVVIELKRTDDGGHMELQALRYAAMVSSMGLEEVVTAYAAHCAVRRPAEEVNVRSEVLRHLGAEDEGDAVIATDVRILLVSADFGREITSTVLWLNRFEGMDIRCVRLVPYEIEGKVLLDIQQVLPLPEAADYQVRLRRKDTARERATSADGRDYTRYHVVVEGTELPALNKRNAIRTMVQTLVDRGVHLSEIRALFLPRLFRVVPGRPTNGDAVRAELLAAGVDLRRWFTDHPLIDDTSGETYVMTGEWGRNTEEALRTLADAFPEAKVTFRPADD